MKLRTTHNSIRIRIRKSELVSLKENSIVEEQIAFPGGVVFKFALYIDDKEEEVLAKLDQNTLTVSIPGKDASQWMSTNEVSIERNIKLDNENALHILIEKDFPCLDRPEEDKSDTFWELAPDNPEAC